MPPNERRRRRLSMLTPLAVAAAVAGITMLPRAASGGSAHPVLRPRSAAQLLVDVQQANVSHLSGTVVATSRLGLPSLATQALAPSGLAELVSGSHTMQVAYGGPDQQRLAVLDSLAEIDVVHNGRDLWTYQSRTNRTSHQLLAADHHSVKALPTELPVTPQEAARRVLAAIDPTTYVSVDRTARVAGRPAYQLVLAPKQSASLVRSVRIAIDAATHVPLRVQVYGLSGTTAFEVGFTDISFTAPDPASFAFTPPAGSTPAPSTELRGPPVPGPEIHVGPGDPRVRGLIRANLGTPPGFPRFPARPAITEPKWIGTGWTTVVELPPWALPPVLFEKAAGRVLVHTALVNVLRTDDGRVFAGAVTASFLERVASITR